MQDNYIQQNDMQDNDIQYDDTQHKDIQHNGRALLRLVSFNLSVIYADCQIQALYVECHYAECRGADFLAANNTL
jgi:hypothetical protein